MSINQTFARTFAILSLALPLLAATASAVAAPPNVVLIISDDQAWTDYGFMQHPHIQTPHLDRLASQSLTFTRGYVPDSLCRPSLATMITGLYPHQHGIVGNDPPPPEDLANASKRAQRRDPRYLQRRLDYLHHIDDDPTIAGILHERLGYLSHQSGKWWEGNYRRGGFTHGMTHGDRTRGGRHGDEGLKIGRQGMQPVFDFIELANSEEKPFFVWYAPFLPHLPHNPPQRLLDKYKDKTPHEPVAKYWAMCEWFDETCGQLLDHLDEQGLAENTIVLYVTDNGWINDTRASRHAPRSKRSQYDGGIRTPIMIRWPGHVEPKLDTTNLASSIDLAPTILAACGLEPTKDMDGINLLDAKAVEEREALFGEIFDHDIRSMDDPVASLRYRWVVDGQWKLIVPYTPVEGDVPVELFRISQDEHEQHNVAQDHPQVVEALTAKLNAWWDPAKPQAAVEGKAQSADHTAANDRPNILFFLSDDHRADFLRCAGHKILQTPFLDDLAHRGVRFENAFVTTSICAASRASLLTGMWERTHKYTFGTPPIAGELVETSYPRVLKEAGYRTGFVGKYGVATQGKREAEMFDVFERVNRNPYFHKQPDGSLRHATDICGDKAIEFVRNAQDDQPWCLSVSFNAAHAEDRDKVNHYPFPPSEAGFYEGVTIPPPQVDTDFWKTLPEFFHTSMHRDRYFWRWDTPEKYQRNVKAYYRMITGLDRNIGRVLRELTRRGMADNTVVIFTGDNGYYKASRGFAGKWSHFEESLRVPLIVFDPRLPTEHRGRVDEHMVLNVDVPATICDLATAAVPAGYQGRSLRPLLSQLTPTVREGNAETGANTTTPPPLRSGLEESASLETTDWRTDFFCEHLMDHPDIPKWEGVRGERYVYARYFEHLPEGEFLHDLQSDPQQLQNLAGDPQHTATLKQMRARTNELRKALGGE